MSRSIIPWAPPVKPRAGSLFRHRQDGLQLFYLFTEGGGTVIHDVIRGHWGSVLGSPSWKHGLHGPEMEFDGTDDYVNLGMPKELNNAAQLSVTGVVTLSNTSNLNSIIYNRPGTSNLGWDITPWSDGVLYLDVFTSGSGYTAGSVSYSNAGISSGAPFHYAMVYDGTETGNANRLKLWVNGVPVTLSFSGTIPASLTTNGADIQLGFYEADGEAWLTGSMEYVKCWDRPLAPEDVARDFYHPYEDFYQVRRWFVQEGGGGATFDETVSLALGSSFSPAPTVSMDSVLALDINAAITEGNAADLTGLVGLNSSIGLTQSAGLLQQAIIALSMGAAIAWVENLTKEEVVAFNLQSSVVSTNTATLNVIAALIGNLAITANGSVQMDDSFSLSMDAGVTWVDSVGEIIEAIALSLSTSMTLSEQADLVGSLTLSLNAAIATQTQAIINALMSLGVNANLAQAGGLALMEAMTLQLSATLSATNTVASAQIGNILKLVSEQLSQPWAASEGLDGPNAINETLDT